MIAVVAFLEVGEFLLPDLLAGLHVERDDVASIVLAKELAVVDRRARRALMRRTRDAQRAAVVLTGVRQIWRPVATSIANVQLPLTTYITPL